MNIEVKDLSKGEVNTDQYLTFVLDKEIYGIEIDRIKEVLEYVKITHVPGSPDFMRGVINLRGGIVPVADLRSRFGMVKTDVTVDTCIIIVEVFIDGDNILLGAIADSVREVVDIPEESVEPPPALGRNENSHFLRGMGRCGNEFCVLLDIDMLFGDLVDDHEAEH